MIGSIRGQLFLGNNSLTLPSYRRRMRIGSVGTALITPPLPKSTADSLAKNYGSFKISLVSGE